MQINNLIQTIVVWSRPADKSAVTTINRVLRLFGGFILVIGIIVSVRRGSARRGETDE